MAFFSRKELFFEFSKENYIKEIYEIKSKNIILIPEQIIYRES